MNELCSRFSYSIPNKHILFKQFENKKYFSTFDLKSGFYHCTLEEKNKHWTIFITLHGLYEMNILPFGYLNSHAEFQKFTNMMI